MDRPSFDPSAAETWLNPRFLQKLLILFDQEDPLEREYLKSIVHKIYAKFVSLRGFIRKSIGNIFLTFIYETQRHNGISELLEIYASIINGFALPLKEEHKIFLQKTLIPLHKMEAYCNYHVQLTYCLAKFLAKDPHFTLLIFQNILRVWPIADSTKQILLLEEIDELLYYADLKELRLIARSLTFRVSSWIESLNFQVADRAMLFLNNKVFLQFLSQNLNFYPIILASLHANSTHHWHRAIGLMATNMLVRLERIAPCLFSDCKASISDLPQ